MTSSARRLAAGLAVALAVLMTVLLAAPSADAAVPGPSQYPEYWWDTWGIPSLWSAGHDGKGVTVAIIDTGVQKIPPLSSSLVPGTDFTGLGGNGETDREIDTFSHGTGMASIIAARNGPANMQGVAPGASIMPIAVPLEGVHATRQGDYTAEAINYAVGHGAKIVSMSFGARRSSVSNADNPCPSDVQTAVFHALAKGVLVVAASGNDGQHGSPVTDPSVCLGVISVAAVDSNNKVASFSSRHRYVTVAAPGVKILSLSRTGDLYIGDGTSQATAMASGALALIWSAHPHDTNRQIAARLMAGLRDTGPKGRDSQYGYGLINPGRSAAATVTATSPNPVFTAADPYLKALSQTQTALNPPKAVSPSRPGHAVRGAATTKTTTNRAVIAFVVAGLALIVLVAALWPRPRQILTVQPPSDPQFPGWPAPQAWQPPVWQPPVWQPPTQQWPPPPPPPEWPPSERPD